MPKHFKAIAAMAENRVIGQGNKLPWHLPEELKWFKKMTVNQVIIMGRKTFESIGRPLPNRETIVLTRSGFHHSGVQTRKSLAEIPMADDPREFFIVGGAEIFAQALPQCSDLYLTRVKKQAEGDVFFPPFEDQFELVGTLQENPDFTIFHYRRKSL